MTAPTVGVPRKSRKELRPTDDDHVDAIGDQLSPQIVGEALHRMLGGGVGRHEGRAVLAAHRGDIDHPAWEPLEGHVRPQQGQERLHCFELFRVLVCRDQTQKSSLTG